MLGKSNLLKAEHYTILSQIEDFNFLIKKIMK